jgi:hypothetical protein
MFGRSHAVETTSAPGGTGEYYAMPTKLHVRASLERRLPHLRAARRAASRGPNYSTNLRGASGEHRSGGDRARCGREWGHQKVVAELLANPKTTEDDVVRLAALRPARATSIEAIGRTRWLTRRRVRMTVLLNPGSPPRVARPLVGLCTRSELLEIARGADVPVILRITANELAERRPPLFGENASERGSEPPSGPRLLQ